VSLKRQISWLAVGLGTAYAASAVILLVVEPGMGFRGFQDFWKPDLVVPALTSTAWLISDLCHLLSGALLIVLAASLRQPAASPSRLLPMLGLAAGMTFVLVAMIDRAAAWLPHMVVQPVMLATLAVGFVATRTGILLAALFFLGGFIAAIAWVGRRRLPVWFVILSFAVAIMAMGFVLVPTPVPLALSAWAFALAWVWWSEPGDSG
jgi:hypothetical protein